MEKIGHALVDAQGNEVVIWGDTPGQVLSPPDYIQLPNGDVVGGAKVGDALGAWRLVERFFQSGAENSVVFDGRRIVRTQAPTTADIDAERDRRLAVFVFNEVMFDFNDVAKGDIAGAGTLALAAIINGAQPGDMSWADTGSEFSWISGDNSYVFMDAQTTFAFAQAAAKWRARHVFAARRLKDTQPIPANYTEDVWWA